MTKKMTHEMGVRKPVWPILAAALAILVAGFTLHLLYKHLSLSPDVDSSTATYNPTEVVSLLDDAQWWLTQGETDVALEILDELESYCQTHGVEAPVELDELYEEAFDDWLFFPDEPSSADPSAWLEGESK